MDNKNYVRLSDIVELDIMKEVIGFIGWVGEYIGKFSLWSEKYKSV